MRKFLISLSLIFALAFPSSAAEYIQYNINQNTLEVLVQDEPNQSVTITIDDNSRKYYIDQGNTDANGQIRFKIQLEDNKIYNSSVKTSRQIETKEISIGKPEQNSNSPQKQTASISIRGLQGNILNRKQIEIEEGDTVLDVLKRALYSENIDFIIESNGYIKSINGEVAGRHGPLSGWIYRINENYEAYRNMAASDAKINSGDLIEWRYSKDGGLDIGWETGQYPTEFLKEEQALTEIEAILTDPSTTIEQMEKILDTLFAQYDADPTILSNPEIKNTITALAEKIVETTRTVKISADEIQKNADGYFIRLDQNKILDKAELHLKTITKIENKINDMGLTKTFPKKLDIQLPLSEERQITTVFPDAILKELFTKGLENIHLKTEIASFNVAPDTFDSPQQENEMRLIMKETNIPDISSTPAVDIQWISGKQSTIRFSEPIEVCIPYLRTVNTPEKISAFRLNEVQTLEPVGGIYSKSTNTVSFLTGHFSIYFAQESQKTFEDLKTYQWAKKSIENMASKGIINGRDGQYFDPGTPITRAEFAALATKMLRYDETVNIKSKHFEDLKPDDWYFNAVQSAYQKGLMKGVSDNRFNPEENITRQEIAVILANILAKKSDVKEIDISILEKFKDREQIAPWAQKSVALLLQKSLLSGIEEDIVAPRAQATRAQTAVLLEKVYPFLFNKSI